MKSISNEELSMVYGGNYSQDLGKIGGIAGSIVVLPFSFLTAALFCYNPKTGQMMFEVIELTGYASGALVGGSIGWAADYATGATPSNEISDASGN